MVVWFGYIIIISFIFNPFSYTFSNAFYCSTLIDTMIVS